jgi:hypothetical protein
MSQVGFYRYKTTASVFRIVNWTVNFINVGSKQISPIDSCVGSLIVKYLDKNGQYRFFPFNKFYETTDAPEKIGDVNRFIVDIQTDQSDTQNVGYRNKRQISATTQATSEQLEKLSDIYASPRVYLYIGDGTTDLKSDWVEVDIQAFNPLVRRRRGNNGYISITITLPTHYTIKMV